MQFLYAPVCHVAKSGLCSHNLFRFLHGFLRSIPPFSGGYQRITELFGNKQLRFFVSKRRNVYGSNQRQTSDILL